MDGSSPITLSASCFQKNTQDQPTRVHSVLAGTMQSWYDTTDSVNNRRSLIWLTDEIVGFYKPLKIMSCFKHRHKYHRVPHNNVYTWKTSSTLNFICLCRLCLFIPFFLHLFTERDAHEERTKHPDSILAEAQFSPWANSELPSQMRSLTSPRILMTFIDVFNKFFLSVGY